MASRGDYCIALATLGSTNICGLSIDEHSNADHDFNSAVLDRQIHDKYLDEVDQYTTSEGEVLS